MQSPMPLPHLSDILENVSLYCFIRRLGLHISPRNKSIKDTWSTISGSRTYGLVNKTLIALLSLGVIRPQ